MIYLTSHPFEGHETVYLPVHAVEINNIFFKYRGHKECVMFFSKIQNGVLNA